MIDKLPFLPDDHHYAIAAVAARATQLEGSIETAVGFCFLAVPHAAEFILKNLNGDRYVLLLEKLMHDLNPQKRALITRVFSRVRHVRTERNEILHWLWGKAENPTDARFITNRPFREKKEKTRTAAEILGLANEMLDLSLVVSALAFRSPVPLSSHDKREPQAHRLDSVWQKVLDRYEKGEPLGLQQGPSLK